MDSNKSNKGVHMKNNKEEYNYEEIFNKNIESLHELFIEEMLRNKKGIHYVTKTISAGKVFEVEIYPIFPNGEGSVQEKKDNTKAQRNLNDKNARKRFVRLVNQNFTEKDLMLTLTYESGYYPKSIEEAVRNVQNYMRRINRKRKKQGLGNAKYIYITEWEQGEKEIRCHHHVFISGDLDRDVIEKTWEHSSRNETRRLNPDEFSLTGLATYLTKGQKGKRKWNSSKNLKKPKIKRNYSKMSKKKVEKMVKDRTYLEDFFAKDTEYAKYKFVNAEIRYNDFNAAFYIHINARKNE